MRFPEDHDVLEKLIGFAGRLLVYLAVWLVAAIAFEILLAPEGLHGDKSHAARTAIAARELATAIKALSPCFCKDWRAEWESIRSGKRDSKPGA